MSNDEGAISGRLMRVIGHELRNRLGVMKNSSYYLSMRLADQDEKLKRHLTLFQDEIRSMDRMITDLMDLSWVKRTVFAEADLNGILRDALAAVALPEGVAVRTDFSEELPLVRVDVDQMSRVFSSIMLLVGESLGSGGELVVGTRRDDSHVEARLFESSGSAPADDPETVFDPLSAAMARGIGLALAVSRKLIQNHGGEIHVQSAAPGTTYTIRLPIREPEEA